MSVKKMLDKLSQHDQVGAQEQLGKVLREKISDQLAMRKRQLAGTVYEEEELEVSKSSEEEALNEKE